MYIHANFYDFWCFGYLDTGVQWKEDGKTVKYHNNYKYYYITPVLQDFAEFFLDIISFQIFFTLMLLEVKLNGI